MDSGKRLRWADIGNATDPGDYRVGEILINVSRNNIETWQANPSARFVVIYTDEIVGGRSYALGTWEA